MTGEGGKEMSRTRDLWQELWGIVQSQIDPENFPPQHTQQQAAEKVLVLSHLILNRLENNA